MRNQMDPATETIIYGSDLREGMRVRRDGYKSEYGGRLTAAEEFCTVTRLERGHFYGDGALTTLRFVALYDDGQQEVHSANENTYHWVVKRSTLPVSSPDYRPLSTHEAYKLIMAALDEVRAALLNSLKGKAAS